VDDRSTSHDQLRFRCRHHANANRRRERERWSCANPRRCNDGDGCVFIVRRKDEKPVGPFTPASLQGLSLWLDGWKGLTVETGGAISKWSDQSGNGNDAVSSPWSLENGFNPGSKMLEPDDHEYEYEQEHEHEMSTNA
jgi:hypothetical protein